MPNIEDIKKNLASYKTLHRKQGDFTLYASKYIQHIEVLLGLIEGPAASAKSRTSGGPVTRKKKLAEESTDL